MKQGCTLIATLPNLANAEMVRNVLSCPDISEARINTGVSTLMSVDEVVATLKKLSTEYSKRIWVDLKGRQLRIARWADPRYEAIELNHQVEVVYPAKIYFRNGGCRNILRTRGNQILVDSPPQEAVGAGQSVNIIAKELDVIGYLTELDKQYLEAMSRQEMNGVFASFVERLEDLSDIAAIMPKAEIVSKIESLKGIELITKNRIGTLMAARDDLYLESGQNYSMLKHLETIIENDSNAICASRIFTSLEKREHVDLADFSDLTLMYNLGYRRFMLCDNICNYHFNEAICAWREFLNG
ncbi:MAG: hypothetical protein LBL91_05730 [Lachnospiraceae bacterium]|nr:hypothetical protein [Lachnospiraceae bacterium]